MTTKQRIGTVDPQTKEKGSTAAYVIEAKNHLLQMRRFAYDGRYWLYQPDNRSPFQRVNPMDVPAGAVEIMAAHSGIDQDTLRQPD